MRFEFKMPQHGSAFRRSRRFNKAGPTWHEYFCGETRKVTVKKRDLKILPHGHGVEEPNVLIGASESGTTDLMLL
jgi:hypothetical protein